MGFRNMGRRYCSRGRPGTSLGGWRDLTSPVQCAKPPSVWRVEVKESRERAGRGDKDHSFQEAVTMLSYTWTLNPSSRCEV